MSLATASGGTRDAMGACGVVSVVPCNRIVNIAKQSTVGVPGRPEQLSHRPCGARSFGRGSLASKLPASQAVPVCDRDMKLVSVRERVGTSPHIHGTRFDSVRISVTMLLTQRKQPPRNGSGRYTEYRRVPRLALCKYQAGDHHDSVFS